MLITVALGSEDDPCPVWVSIEDDASSWPPELVEDYLARCSRSATGLYRDVHPVEVQP